MIGRLSGRLVASESEGKVLVDVAGVGYEVTVPLGTSARAGAPAQGDSIVLHVHTHVREDALELYGFASEAARRAFRMLIALPNVGPKLALAILGALPLQELADAIAARDLARLTSISGVGRRTAERLILELRERLGQLGADDTAVDPRGAGGIAGDEKRLIGALTSMGYRPAEAARAVEALGSRVGAEPISELLKAALAELAR